LVLEMVSFCKSSSSTLTDFWFSETAAGDIVSRAGAIAEGEFVKRNKKKIYAGLYRRREGGGGVVLG
jgi:hypothetical protein